MSKKQAMEKYNNEDFFLEALKREDPRAFRKFYELHYGKIAAYVVKNSGDAEAVQDIFQEAVIVLLRYLRKPDFNLNENTQIGTFFFGIAKRMWLMKLRKRKIKKVELTDREVSEESGLEEKMIFEEKHELIAKHFNQIGDDCQKILTDFYFKKIKLQEIGKTLGYTSSFIRVKKNRCMNSLKKLVANDNDYKKLTEN